MSRLIEFDLPARPEAGTNDVLLALLRANPALPIRISARLRRRLDVPLLQILLAARQHWHSRGIAFDLADLSADHIADLALLGLSPGLEPNQDGAGAELGFDPAPTARPAGANFHAEGGVQMGAA